MVSLRPGFGLGLLAPEQPQEGNVLLVHVLLHHVHQGVVWEQALSLSHWCSSGGFWPFIEVLGHMLVLSYPK